MPQAIHISPIDNVVVALHPIAKGTLVEVDGLSVTALEDIPAGPQDGREAHQERRERHQVRLPHRPCHRRCRAGHLDAHPQCPHQPVR